jgi:hypothetical protein
MPADSVIEYFDPFENVLSGFFSGPIVLMMHVFRFQRMEETFHDRIIPALPTPTHARCQAVIGEHLAIPRGGVLGGFKWSSVCPGHGERRQGQLLRETAVHSPGNDPARVQIAHHRQIEPASAVQMYVMSPTHTRWGTGTANCRWSVFGTTGCGCAESVVARHFVIVFARIAFVRMSRATRCAPIRWPWACRVAWIRGLP